MGRLYGRLKIELMSDLCAGSGYSYAGIIDTDVNYDACGIPVIPARRIKGCMREAAELVCPEAVEALFGRSGDRGVRGILLGNAYIEDYEAVTGELHTLRDGGCREAYYLSPQNILEQYTGIRAQTMLDGETGTAQENSLRFTRVVRQRDPRRAGENLCFYAEVEYEEAYREPLKRIVKAVRNLGMNRSRGLGSVRCSLRAAEKTEKPSAAAGREQRAGRVCLTYVLRNREPLLMSSDNTGVSDSHISGRSILGMFAGAYLRREGATAESEEFRKLFLEDATIFTDANITFPPGEGEENAACWPAYYPAPLTLNRLKKTKVLVNLLGEKRELSESEAALYRPENGNQPKKLRTHYVHEAEPNTFHIAEADREILYHNSRSEQLYYLEALSEGQYFRGCIYTDQEYADLLKNLLENGRLSFGKSKTAQYGACELAAEVDVRDIAADDICVEAGESVAVVFGSDAAFLKENGYTVRCEEVKELIGESLGIPYDKTVDRGSMIQTKELTGYNTTWNLRRPAVPGIKAGSVLVYTIRAGSRWSRSLPPDACFVGEMCREGCGEVRVLKCRDMVYEARRISTSAKKEGDGTMSPESCLVFLQSILTEQLLERLAFLYTKSEGGLNLNSAMIERVYLMLRESLNAYGKEPDRAFADFGHRIASIKRVKERREAFRLLDRLMRKENGDEEQSELDLDKMTEGGGDEILRELRELLRKNSTETEYREKISGIWGRYMEKVLIYHKYRKKQEGGSGDEEA